MFDYYLKLALRSFKRNKVLTALMVLALGLGIGAAITTLTVLKVLSGDPMPQKSAQLFHPAVDPHPSKGYVPGQTQPPITLSYVDAMNLLRAGKAKRQVVLAMTSDKIVPIEGGERPFFSSGVITSADFFAMFDVPFEYGSGWSAGDGESGAHVAVISTQLNDKLFGGRNSVGKNVRVNDRDFRIIGVLKPWSPQPRFYSVGLRSRSYGNGVDVYVPLQTALAEDFQPQNVSCWEPSDMHDIKTAPCMWLGMWVELPDAAAVATYKTWLSNYAKQQVDLGRFQRSDVALPNLTEFLVQQQVVPDDARIQTYLAFGFLVICVLNTVGLLLAKCLRRSREIGVRRALGATRHAVFVQFMVEAGIVGVAGGVLGLVLAELGLWAVRHQPAQYAHLAHLDLQMFVFTFVIALVASLIAGLLPAWRACVVAPAPQLKDA